LRRAARRRGRAAQRAGGRPRPLAACCTPLGRRRAFEAPQRAPLWAGLSRPPNNSVPRAQPSLMAHGRRAAARRPSAPPWARRLRRGGGAEFPGTDRFGSWAGMHRSGGGSCGLGRAVRGAWGRGRGPGAGRAPWHGGAAWRSAAGAAGPRRGVRAPGGTRPRCLEAGTRSTYQSSETMALTALRAANGSVTRIGRGQRVGVAPRGLPQR
jgi:hypothetical protein